MDSDNENGDNLWFLHRNMDPEYDDDDDDDFSNMFATLYTEAEGSDGDEGKSLDLDLLPSDICKPKDRSVQDKAEKEKKKIERERESQDEKEREKIRQQEKQKQKEIEKQKAKEEESHKDLEDPTWLDVFFGILPKQEEKDPSAPPGPEKIEPLPEESVDSKDIDEWIKAEGLNEPLSDIPEYNLLLGLAADYDKNYNILFKVLTPTTKTETSESECEMMETELLSPSPPPFEISPESTEILMLSPEPVTPAGELDIDMDRPSTSKEALKALSQAGTPKNA